MDYCLKTMKNIEHITKTFKCISRLRKLLSVFLVGYTAFKIVMYFLDR